MTKIDFVGKATAINISSIITPSEINIEDPGKDLVIKGDNLGVLTALVPHYKGRVKCVYIDPPYNTGSGDWVFDDTTNSPTMANFFERYYGANAPKDRHDRWMCFMTPRLKLLKKLLSDDGILLVSIDDAEVAHLRMLLDEIFGEDNFITTLVWDSPDPSRKGDMGDSFLSGEHEYVLVYARNKAAQGIFLNSSDKSMDNRWRPSTGISTIVGRGLYTEDGLIECEKIFGGRVFDYPKPSELIKEIIAPCIGKKDIVLDCFAGTGTTAQAVIKLNAEDNGGRKFIIIESQDYAHEFAKKRIEYELTRSPMMSHSHGYLDLELH